MKNKIIYIGLCLMCFSCGNFLEPKSKSEFIPRDASSLNELLLGEAYPRVDLQGLNRFLGLLDDDIACSAWYELPEGKTWDAWHAAFSWQPDLYVRFKENGEEGYNIYQTHYKRILGANAVLDYLPGTDGEEEDQWLVRAQALSLRAFYYLNLVNLYGAPYYTDPTAPGVPLKLTSAIESNAMRRNTVEEVYAQILKDLLEAESLYMKLPEEMQWKQDYRTNLPMVQLLLSRVYLYMEKWEEAAAYARKVTTDDSFFLIDLNTIAETDKYGVRTYYNYFTYANPEVIWLYGNITDVSDMISQESVSDNFYNTHCMFRASEELMACFDRTPGDLRKSRYVVLEKTLTYQEGSEQFYMPQPFGKFNISYDYQPGSVNSFARSLRLSEAWLNLAEASAMLYKQGGNASASTDALDAVNTLRRYRIDIDKYTPENITDPDKLIDFIREERRRELCFEDHRWFDLRRWGMPEIRHRWIAGETTILEFVLQKNDPAYTLPLPLEALELNKDLVQNPLAATREGTLINN